MGIITELSSATGDVQSNEEIAKRCITTPVLLHSIAEGLRTGSGDARNDCMDVLRIVGQRNPSLLAEFTTELWEVSTGEYKVMARHALKLLALIVPSNPSAVFAERTRLLSIAQKESGPLALAAASVIAALCAHSVNYRGKLASQALRLIAKSPDSELARWLETLGPAIHGSADAIKRLDSSVKPRLATLEPSTSQRVERTLDRLRRSATSRR